MLGELRAKPAFVTVCTLVNTGTKSSAMYIRKFKIGSALIFRVIRGRRSEGQCVVGLITPKPTYQDLIGLG